MTCNHAKIYDSDWSDAANVDAGDAGVNFFVVLTLADADKCENVFTI